MCRTWEGFTEILVQGGQQPGHLILLLRPPQETQKKKKEKKTPCYFVQHGYGDIH